MDMNLPPARLFDIMISFRPQGIAVAQFVVRNIEEDVKARLKRRADIHGLSMEAEIRQILRNAAREEHQPPPKLGSRIAARFKKVGLTTDLPELRGQSARSAEFGK